MKGEMGDSIQTFIEEGLLGKSYEHALKQFEEWLQETGTDLISFARSDVQQYIDTVIE